MTAATVSEDEGALVAALRAGDHRAFARLVDRHTPAMLRVARGYVPSEQHAEDVVQETWIALLKGLDRFEGRSSLRTWLFTVLVNIAKTRGLKERRHVDTQIKAFTGGTVDPERFRAAGDELPGTGRRRRHRLLSRTPLRARLSAENSPTSPSAISIPCLSVSALS